MIILQPGDVSGIGRWSAGCEGLDFYKELVTGIEERQFQIPLAMSMTMPFMIVVALFLPV